MNLVKYYEGVRSHTEKICKPLATEDYIPQPIVDVSPPKWHIAHTSWFFETFILKTYMKEYQEYDPVFNFLFNSYYENVGKRLERPNRGFLTRPTVKEVYNYRRHVDEWMVRFLSKSTLSDEITALVILGLNHEQQHQELLWTDIKYILGSQPHHPAYLQNDPMPMASSIEDHWVGMAGGTYSIGFSGEGFCFDNELNPHKKYLEPFQIRQGLVSNGEYLEFIESGGYQNSNYWHSEGWAWLKEHRIDSPLYWKKHNEDWVHYTLGGLAPLNRNEAVCHVSYYEAHAFAEWAGARLPTEEEWEVSSDKIEWGDRWEWTNSAYLPYPGYQKAEGAVGEYNGKFMVSQMVLRGASVATPDGHSRKTYRNFWHPLYQFQFSGIRLAK